MSKSKILPFIFLCSVLLNVGLFFVFFHNRTSPLNQSSSQSLSDKYPYLARRALLDNPSDFLINFFDLRTELQCQTASYGDKFAFYFQYLPTGTSIGVNGSEQFHAASLFKLPVIMAYYHYLERTGGSDSQMATVMPADIDKQFGDLYKKGPGYKLPMSEAVRLAIEDSDNTAAKVIADQVQQQDFDAVYQGLDITLDTDKNGAIITAKNYSSILQALYFSAVINRDDSEKLLDLMTKTKFSDKLAAGIPTDIPVAHKIGDFNDFKGNTAFTDCGIVYLPKRAYMLCMLSIGDQQTAIDRMSSVSRVIYKYLTSAQTSN